MTALIEAASYGSNEMVDALLRHGADVNPPLLRDIPNYSRFATHEYVGRTVEGPICGAVSGVRLRDPAVAIMLLERGANPNVLSRFGQTPLCVATENKDIRMVQLLLEPHQVPRNGDPFGSTFVGSLFAHT